MSKFLSMEALRRVSSWWVPFSISSLAAEGSDLKPRFLGGSLIRRSWTESRAVLAR